MSTKILDQQIVAKNRWTTFIKEQTLLPDGLAGDYLIVERGPGLMIIPLVKENGHFFTYLVKQYRHPIGKAVWQFPMGTLEKRHDAAQYAMQELREETGLSAQKITPIGKYYVDPGLSRQICLVFIATDIVEKGEQKLEVTEHGLEVAKVRVEDISRMIENGEVNDSWGFSGIYYLQKYLSEQDAIGKKRK